MGMRAHSGTVAGRRLSSAARPAVSAVAALALALGGCAAPEELVARFDNSRTQISRGLVDVVDGVDRAFGEPRVEDREKNVQLKLGLKGGWISHQSPSVSVPLSLRVPLPALERYANISLRLSSVAEASEGTGEAAASLDRNTSLSATVLSHVVDRVDTGVHATAYWRDGGLQTGLQPFLRWDWRPASVRFSLEQQVFLQTDTLFGAKSIIEIDRVFGQVALVRLRNIVEDSQQVAGESVEHDLIYRRPLPSLGAALSVEFGAVYNAFDGDPETGLRGGVNDPDKGFGRVRLTGTVLRPWLEYEITPTLYYYWRHKDEMEYGISVMLRAVFEGNRATPPAP